VEEALSPCATTRKNSALDLNSFSEKGNLISLDSCTFESGTVLEQDETIKPDPINNMANNGNLNAFICKKIMLNLNQVNTFTFLLKIYLFNGVIKKVRTFQP
jgi:hypothetical protein